MSCELLKDRRFLSRRKCLSLQKELMDDRLRHKREGGSDYGG